MHHYTLDWIRSCSHLCEGIDVVPSWGDSVQSLSVIGLGVSVSFIQQW